MVLGDQRRPIRAVVFDFGGVLIRPTGRMGERLAEFGLGLEDVGGIFMGPGAVESVMGGQCFSIVDMMPHVEARLPASLMGDRRAAAETLLSVYVSDDLMGWDESMAALMRRLHSAGVGVGLLANGPVDIEAAFFHRLDGIVDASVLSGRDGVGKPSREAFELIAARLGVSLGECFFVDDNAHNTDAGRGLGMSTHLYDGDIAAFEAALRSAGIPTG